jgi:cell wall assembly regulator SMI1
MVDLWSRLERQLFLHAADLAASLRPGAGESAIAAFEAVIETRLPDDVREAYLWHDGCDMGDDFLKAQKALGLFGCHRWLPLAECQRHWQWNLGGFDGTDPYACDDDNGAWSGWAIRPWLAPPPNWIPLAERRNPTTHLYSDLLPGPAGVAGQLVGEDVHGGPRIWLEARSLRTYLIGLADGLESGDIVVHHDLAVGTHTWAYRNSKAYVAAGHSMKPYARGD